MVFVFDILPTKQYHIVGRSHMYCTVTTKNFPRTGQKFTAHENLPPEKYPLYSIHNSDDVHVHVNTW